MAQDNFLTTKSVLGLAERVVMAPPPQVLEFDVTFKTDGSEYTLFVNFPTQKSFVNQMLDGQLLTMLLGTILVIGIKTVQDTNLVVLVISSTHKGIIKWNKENRFSYKITTT